MSRPQRRIAGAAGVLTLLLTGCVPAIPDSPPQAAVAMPSTWRDGMPASENIGSDWWRQFNDPQLNRLVEGALAHNTDLLIAASRIEEANATLRQARAGLFPALNAVVGGQAARSLSVLGPSESRSWQPELDLSWELDLWGRIRQQTRAANAQFRATQAARQGAALSVAASTANAYIGLLAMDKQLAVTKETVVSRQKALTLIEEQVREGYASALELTQAQSEYESVMQAVPKMEQAIRQQENGLSLLTGQPPGSIARMTLDTLTLPRLPAMLPSELLRRRPDIIESEQQLAAADAQLRARRAEFLPQLNLSASIGEIYTSGLNYDPVRIWSYGGSVLAPLFSAGRLQAQFDTATAQRDQAAYRYRATVLQALNDAENGFAARQGLSRQRQHSDQRVGVLDRSLQVANDRYENGYASYLTVLDAQRGLYNAQLDNITLKQDDLQNYVALYKALGGGWVSAISE